MRYILVFLVFISLFSCMDPGKEENPVLVTQNNPANKLAEWKGKLDSIKPLVKSGDLITRAGSDAISNSLRNFNKKDKTYSHSGIALIEGGEIYVYHTLSGDENPTDKMMREPFDSFVNPVKKNGVGIFRYDLTENEIQKFGEQLRFYYKKEMKFDKIFDLKDDSKMYCAEVISKSLNKATDNRIIIPTTIVRNFRVKDHYLGSQFRKEFEYIALDNLYQNTHCKEIARIEFN